MIRGIDFDLVPKSDYTGYGEDVLRFPTAYRSYGETTNTKLLSPLGAVVKAGAEAKFEIQSKDFQAMALVVNGELQVMSKNQKNGNFEMSLVVPNGIEKLDVMASKNGKNFTGLYFYMVK